MQIVLGVLLRPVHAWFVFKSSAVFGYICQRGEEILYKHNLDSGYLVVDEVMDLFILWLLDYLFNR